MPNVCLAKDYYSLRAIIATPSGGMLGQKEVAVSGGSAVENFTSHRHRRVGSAMQAMQKPIYLFLSIFREISEAMGLA